jgi:hypothetical protein
VATPPSPNPSATAPQLTEPMCHASELTASFRRPKGAVFGSIDLTNHGSTTCALEGIPTVTLLDDAGHAYDTERQEIDPFWVVDGASQPRSWPEVKLAAGASARVRVAVINWCYTGLASWELEFSGDGTILIDRVPGLSYVQCTNPGSPATVRVGPVEPSA